MLGFWTVGWGVEVGVGARVGVGDGEGVDDGELLGGESVVHWSFVFLENIVAQEVEKGGCRECY